MNTRDKAGTGAEGAPKGGASPEGAAKLGRDETRGTKMGPGGIKKEGGGPLFYFSWSILVSVSWRISLRREVSQGEKATVSKA